MNAIGILLDLLAANIPKGNGNSFVGLKMENSLQ